MYLLRIGCVLQIFVLARITAFEIQIPISRVREMVKHVKELLLLMDSKLDAYRKGLKGCRQGKEIIEDKPPPVRTNIKLWNDLRADILKNNEAGTIQSDAQLLTLDIMKHMKKKRLGFCEGALIGMMSIIKALEDDEIKPFMDAFGNTIKRMESKGKLAILGDFLVGRIKKHLDRALKTPGNTIKANANIMRKLILYKEPPDVQISKIITDYSTFFEVEDGEPLINKIAELYEFINKKDKKPNALEPLMETIIDAFLAPANNMQDSFEIKALILEINKVYQQRYPDLRRSDSNAEQNTHDDNHIHHNFKEKTESEDTRTVSQEVYSRSKSKTFTRRPRIGRQNQSKDK